MDRLTDRMTFAILESLLGLKKPNLYPPSCLTVMSVIRNGHLNLNGEVQIRMGMIINMHDFEMLRGFGNGQMDRKNDICNFRVAFRAENAIFVPPSCLTVMSVIRNGNLNLNGEV